MGAGYLFIDDLGVSRKPGDRGLSWKSVVWWKPPVSCNRRLRISYYFKFCFVQQRIKNGRFRGNRKVIMMSKLKILIKQKCVLQ
jgi:hypothetical protein